MEVKCEEASGIRQARVALCIAGRDRRRVDGDPCCLEEVSCEETDCTVYTTTLTIVLPKQKHSLWYVSA